MRGGGNVGIWTRICNCVVVSSGLFVEVGGNEQ